uniref:Uncharacterized protein n=1 Tax=Paraburkholderia sprentiae WSM5005 TaxID=754502 RepID=A0A1I9YJV5_9BURK
MSRIEVSPLVDAAKRPSSWQHQTIARHDIARHPRTLTQDDQRGSPPTLAMSGSRGVDQSTDAANALRNTYR